MWVIIQFSKVNTNIFSHAMLRIIVFHGLIISILYFEISRYNFLMLVYNSNRKGRQRVHRLIWRGMGQ